MPKRLLQRFFRSFGYFMIRDETRLRLETKLARLEQECATLKEGLDDITLDNFPIESDGPIYTPVFHYDGLRTSPKVIHNHDFMKDPAFLEAFWAGYKALGHNHRMYWRLHTALFFAKHGLSIEGDFVECGVWRGFLSKAIATYLNWDTVGRTFFLFDTFDGLTDRQLTPDERANTAKIEHLNSHYKNCYDIAVANFSEYRNIHLVRGVVPETLKQADISSVAYLSLDMNSVNPEIAAAEHFWDVLSPSAAIVLDDYGFVSYEEQKAAFDRFAKDRGTEVLALPTGQGIILKP